VARAEYRLHVDQNFFGKNTETQATRPFKWTELSHISCWISVADVSATELQRKMEPTLAANVSEEERYPSYVRNSSCRTSAGPDVSRHLPSAT
jgi:hypothetical protein